MKHERIQHCLVMILFAIGPAGVYFFRYNSVLLYHFQYIMKLAAGGKKGFSILGKVLVHFIDVRITCNKHFGKIDMLAGF